MNTKNDRAPDLKYLALAVFSLFLFLAGCDRIISMAFQIAPLPLWVCVILAAMSGSTGLLIRAAFLKFTPQVDQLDQKETK